MAAFDFPQAKYNFKEKKRGKFTYEWPFNLLLRRDVFTSFGVNLIVFFSPHLFVFVCTDAFISDSAVFMCHVLWPTPYLPQLF